ncbi:response regulator [Carboxylicivirga sp. RSCT41]|uniref:response regulator n=1 Tax=Carboxylicivirga agarovorans TaxID=3417570 RepID=UPI003D33579D
MTFKEEKKILIVDDQPENLQAIVNCFSDKDYNYKFLKAPNGEIAYRLALSKLPDLIITDWDMPQMNGVELISALKKEMLTSDIPVIMCTGVMTTTENLNTALQAGAADYVRKPIDPLELTARVYSMLCLSDSYRQIKQQKAEIDEEKNKVEALFVQSELAYLRSQVSPHFLMNTLNNIHALIDVDAEEAKGYIIILSKLMRHLLYESERETNSIQIEVDFVRNYVELMRLRFEGKVDIQLNIQEALPACSIPPLLFTSLLENAFKHGIGIDKTSFIHIDIKAEENNFLFEIKNLIPDQSTSANKQAGIGIVNTRKRLDLLYRDKYELKITERDNVYTARLKVPFI